MLVPHYGLAGDAGTIDEDILFESPAFMETNFKLGYTVELKRIDSSIEFFGGVSNLFDEYQDDFDSGKNRDSGYIYGPAKPRSVFFGIKLFN
jgi:outer membrane receptor for ferrienterochelin and colicins